MFVYIVTGGWNYEGSQVLEVFSFEKDAQEFAAAERAIEYHFDYVRVTPYKVNDGEKS